MADNQMSALVYEEGLEKLRGRQIASFGGRTAATPDEWDAVAKAGGFDPEDGELFYEPSEFDHLPDGDEARMSLEDKMALRLELNVTDLPEVKALLVDLGDELRRVEGERDESEAALVGYREAVGEELGRFLGSLVDDGVAVDVDAEEFPILDRALNAIGAVAAISEPEATTVGTVVTTNGGPVGGEALPLIGAERGPDVVVGQAEPVTVVSGVAKKPNRRPRGKKDAVAPEVAS